MRRILRINRFQLNELKRCALLVTQKEVAVMLKKEY